MSAVDIVDVLVDIVAVVVAAVGVVVAVVVDVVADNVVVFAVQIERCWGWWCLEGGRGRRMQWE